MVPGTGWYCQVRSGTARYRVEPLRTVWCHQRLPPMASHAGVCPQGIISTDFSIGRHLLWCTPPRRHLYWYWSVAYQLVSLTSVDALAFVTGFSLVGQFSQPGRIPFCYDRWRHQRPFLQIASYIDTNSKIEIKKFHTF